MTTRSLVLALATAMGMVDRVHNGTANGRTNAEPTVTAGLADLDVGMLGIANLADGRTAGEQNATHLGRRHTQDGVLAFLAHELNAGASGTSKCSALARLELNGMDESTDGDVGQRHCIAGLDVGIGTGDDHIAYMKTLRMKDVALLAVDVMKERDAGIADDVIEDALASLDVETERSNAIKLARRLAHSLKEQSSCMQRQTLVNKLVTKGYSFELAKQVSESIELDENDDEALQRTIAKAKRLYATFDQPKRNQKIQTYCVRKGFNISAIKEVLEGENE